jgi:hypothetical protein
MNKANNRITFRLQSYLDGSLGVEHAKDFTFSMVITGHIDSHVDAFRSFLVAASFPQALVDKALVTNERLEEIEDDLSLARQQALDSTLQLVEAKDLIAELQEANEMPGAGRGVPPNRQALLDADPLAMGDEIKPGHVMSDTAGELYRKALLKVRMKSAGSPNAFDHLYAHDSLLEPTGTHLIRPASAAAAVAHDLGVQSVDRAMEESLARTALFAHSDAQIDKVVNEQGFGENTPEKPPTQILNVAGIDAGAFGKLGKANGITADIAARLNKLVNDPHFQQYTVAATGANYDEIMDAVEFCVQFVQKNAFTPSFDQQQPLKFTEKLYWYMIAAFEGWAKEKGITLE